MNTERFHTSLRWTSRLVLVLIAVALLYAGTMAIVYWPGIAV